ncbi:hypothetical protein AVEN_80756-1 [Araneus ventricosus]|uniref:Uncharacterized protein n=1 Tax=Araneus ventricosus TaxID=182803 RepID=A0A4Y2CY10_ARAVE|nr:hypothetical protein AVEN_80756-1 [Araneus ventricosus]
MHVFGRIFGADVRYREKILKLYVYHFRGAADTDFIVMNDYARRKRALSCRRIPGKGEYLSDGLASHIFRPKHNRTRMGSLRMAIASYLPSPRPIQDLKAAVLKE